MGTRDSDAHHPVHSVAHSARTILIALDMDYWATSFEPINTRSRDHVGWFPYVHDALLNEGQGAVNENASGTVMHLHISLYLSLYLGNIKI